MQVTLNTVLNFIRKNADISDNAVAHHFGFTFDESRTAGNVLAEILAEIDSRDDVKFREDGFLVRYTAI